MKKQQQNANNNITFVSQQQAKVNPSQKGLLRMVTPLALASVTVLGLGILTETANLKLNSRQETTYERTIGSEGLIDMPSLDDLKEEVKELAIEAVFGDDVEDNGSNINPLTIWWWPF